MAKTAKFNLDVTKSHPLHPQPIFDKNGWLDSQYWDLLFEYRKNQGIEEYQRRQNDQ